MALFLLWAVTFSFMQVSALHSHDNRARTKRALTLTEDHAKHFTLFNPTSARERFLSPRRPNHAGVHPRGDGSPCATPRPPCHVSPDPLVLQGWALRVPWWRRRGPFPLAVGYMQENTSRALKDTCFPFWSFILLEWAAFYQSWVELEGDIHNRDR